MEDNGTQFFSEERTKEERKNASEAGKLWIFH